MSHAQLLESDQVLLQKLVDQFGLDSPTQAQLAHVIQCSPFAANSLERHPDLLTVLLNTAKDETPLAGLEQRFTRQFSAQPNELEPAEFARRLRILRRQEMLIIAWRDLTGIDDTKTTLEALSFFADFAVSQALNFHQTRLINRFGQPRLAENNQPAYPVVIGMGKLGGNELNYSSDIDLIFAYEAEGETDGRRCISNAEFFIRLGQQLIRALNEVTAEGFVFRVDMRLRPHGDEGPLALGFDAIELYYTTQGREWERYAWIKARVIAGDAQTGQQLMDMLRPFVFRRYLDFGAFAQLREIKRMIEREMSTAAMQNNIKLGPGGIREIEFIAQLFQLLRGGREPQLQARGLVYVLDCLNQMGELADEVVSDLKTAYDFLRRAENRLQMQYDQQTQTLPEDAQNRSRLATAMGFTDWETFLSQLDVHRNQVHHHFSQVLRLPDEDQQDDDQVAGVWKATLSEEQRVDVLDSLGFAEPDKVDAVIQSWRTQQSPYLTDVVARRLDDLMPDLLRDIAEYRDDSATIDRMLDLLAAILRRSVYVALLIEQPQARRQLVRLFHASPWIAELLTQHPILLDELIDPETLYSPPDKAALAQELDDLLKKCPDDEERTLDELRRFKQLAILRVAAADIVGALPVMRVSDQLTWIAEVILDVVVQKAHQQIAQRHGLPSALDEHGQTYTPGFAVIGYGKLGGIELGYGSDLDLVFLHNSTAEQAVTTGRRSIDNSLFFARVAQKVVHMLNIRTPAGVLYEVDTRLRPDGVGGLLVSSIRAYEHYQNENAWTWEIQALCRARFITGDADVAQRFEHIRKAVLSSSRDQTQLLKDVVAMRGKMRENINKTPAGRFHLKQDIGGITDIEFLVQYLLLKQAKSYPEILAVTDNIRQLEAMLNCDLISEEDCHALTQAYRNLRDAGHRRTLKGQDSVVEDTVFQNQREQVIELWKKLLGIAPPMREADAEQIQ